MNRLAITFKGRTVYWDIDDDQAANLLASFVQALGPAQEDES